MDKPDEEQQPAAYEVDGDKIVQDASIEPEPDDSDQSEWHRDED